MMLLKSTTIQKTKYFGVGFLCAIFLLLLVLSFVPQLSVDLINTECKTLGCENDSALNIAASIGRLDIISLLLGVFGISIGFFIIYSFFSLKEHAEMIATTTARKVAINAVDKRMDWLESKYTQLWELDGVKATRPKADINKLVDNSGEIDDL